MVPFTSIRPSRALGLLLPILVIGCNPPSEQLAPKTESGLVVEGKIDVVMELSRVDLEKGLQMINRNYIMGPDAAYYLWLVPKTKLLGADRQSGGNAMNIPAPERRSRQ